MGKALWKKGIHSDEMLYLDKNNSRQNILKDDILTKRQNDAQRIEYLRD